MSVFPKQKVSAAITNAAFVSKTTDSVVVSQVTLNKTGSGNQITDAQKAINKAFESSGIASETDATVNTYSSSNFITTGDNKKVAIGKLDTQLKITNDNVNTATTTNGTQDTRLASLESGNMTISGTKTFSGNVTFTGTTTSINAENLDVVDKNITVNKNGNDALSEGAGLTVDRTGTKGSIIYKATSATKFAIGNIGAEVNIADISSVQTLSNKNSTFYDYTEQGSDPTIPDPGFRRIYSKVDGFYERNSAGDVSKIGSGGSGGGVVNLIQNGDGSSSVASIFTPYLNTAQRLPVTGAGGSPTVTTTLSTGGILSGLNSFILTKPASNCRGQGWAVPFEVENTYKAKSLKIAVDYIKASGTFAAGSPTADSDIIWYIYDLTNSQLIEPSNIKMYSNSGTLSDRFEGTFQTSATGSVYRLIAHIATTSVLAFDIAVDNVTVTPQVAIYGTPITDWQTMTGVTGSMTTNTTYSGRKRRVGDMFEYALNAAFTGAPNATTLTFNIPETIDTTKLAPGAVLTSAILGFGTGSVAGANKAFQVLFNSTTSVVLTTITTFTGNASGVNATSAGTIGNGDNISVTFKVPIVGASSSTRLSDGFDGRVVTAKATLALSTFAPTVSTNVKVPFDVVNIDDVGGFSGGSYTVRTSGKYKIYGRISGNFTTGTGELAAYLYRNAAIAEVSTNTKSGAANQPAGCTYVFLVDLRAGDIIELYVFQNIQAGLTIRGNNIVFGLTCINIEKIAGVSTISASEQLNCRYETSAGQSIPANIVTIVNFGTKTFDTHNAVTTGASWKFIAPISGKYRIATSILYNSSTVWALNNAQDTLLYKNNVEVCSLYYTVAQVARTGYLGSMVGSTLINLVAGDFIDIRVQQTPAAVILAAPNYNYVNIERIGN